jgi:RNA polymerase sigma-70 factor (ECF subfamily)
MILRKKRANKELSIDARGDDFKSDDTWELLDCRETPERRYVRHETAELLRKEIRRLNPALRSAIELQHAEEYSVQEIGDSLGISLAAAKSRLLRARVCLRTLLQNKTEVISEWGPFSPTRRCRLRIAQTVRTADRSCSRNHS